MEYGTASVVKKLEARFTIWASNPHTRRVLPLMASVEVALKTLSTIAGMITLRASDRLEGRYIRYKDRGLATRFNSSDGSSADAA